MLFLLLFSLNEIFYDYMQSILVNLQAKQQRNRLL